MAIIRIRRRGQGGIFFDKRRQRWRAKAPRVDGVAKHIGWYDTYREAERAVDAYVATQPPAQP